MTFCQPTSLFVGLRDSAFVPRPVADGEKLSYSIINIGVNCGVDIFYPLALGE